MDKSLGLFSWVVDTASLLRKRTCMTFEDVGFTREEIIGIYEDGNTSEEFVSYIIEKYDLTDTDDDIFK